MTAPATLCTDLSWLLQRASHAMATELTAAMEDLGLSPRGRCVLTAATEGDLTQIEIARAIGLDKTTMVVTLDELEAKGLIERRPSPHDRRARVIAVTPAGRKMLKKAEAVAARVQADVLGTLAEGERDALIAALSSLARGRLAEPAQCATPVRRRSAA